MKYYTVYFTNILSIPGFKKHISFQGWVMLSEPSGTVIIIKFPFTVVNGFGYSFSVSITIKRLSNPDQWTFNVWEQMTNLHFFLFFLLPTYTHLKKIVNAHNAHSQRLKKNIGSSAKVFHVFSILCLLFGVLCDLLKQSTINCKVTRTDKRLR